MYSGLSRGGGGVGSLCNKIQARRALRRNALLALSAAAGIAALSGQVFGQTNDTWLGGGANGSWDTSGNWSSANPPGSQDGGTVNDTATFNSSPTQTTVFLDSTGDTLESITFAQNAGAFTIGSTSGPTLGLTGGGMISVSQNETAAQVINAPIVLEGSTYTFWGSSSYTTAVTGPTGTLTFNGAISGATGATVLTLQDNYSTTVAVGTNVINGIISNGTATSVGLDIQDGTWTLAGSNAFTGGTTLSSGEYGSSNVYINNGNSFGAGPILVNTGPNASIYLTAMQPVTLGTADVFTTATNSNAILELYAQSAPLIINGTFTNSDTAGSTSAITANYIENVSNALLTLNGSVAVGAGTAGTNHALFTSVLNFEPGATSGGLGNIVVNGVISDGATTGYGVVEATTGHGILYLNHSNSYTGGTSIGSGTQISFVNNGLSTAPLIINGGGLQWTSGNSQDISSLFQSTNSNSFFGAGGIGANGASFDTTGNNVSFNSPIDMASTATAGALYKYGAGTLTLNSASNTYEAPIYLEGGTLALGSGAGFTNTLATVHLGAGALYMDSGSGRLGVTSLTANANGAGAITQAGSSLLTLAVLATGTSDTTGNTVDITYASTAASNNLITTLSKNASDSGGQQTILGGWATFSSGSAWAVSGSGATAGAITGLTSYSSTFTTQLDVDAQTSQAPLTASLTINSLRFNNAGAYTISIPTGDSLGIATGGILETSNVGSNNVTISGGTLVNSANELFLQQWNTGAAMYISSVIGGATSYLTKSGPGTVVLQGANTFTAPTFVNMGTLEVGPAGSMLSANITVYGGTLTVDAGATLASTGINVLQVGSLKYVQEGTVNTSGAVNFNNSAESVSILAGAGTVNVGSGNVLTITGVPTAGSTYYGGFYGNINGLGSLVLNQTTSTSTFNLFGGVLNSATASTYSGGTTLNSGVLDFSALDELGNGTVVLNGNAATLQWGGTNADVSSLNSGNGLQIANNVNGTLDTNGKDVYLNNAITGGANSQLTKIGIGTLYLNGSNTWGGNTNVNFGSVELQSGATLASTNLIVSQNTTTNAGNTILSVDAGATLNTGTTLTDNSVVNFNNPCQTIASLNGSINGIVYLNGNGTTGTALTVTNGDNGTPLAAAIEGIGGLTLSGGTLTVNNDNDYYSGGTTLNGGILNFNSASALISPMYSIGTGGITFNGGTLQWGASNTADISTRTVTLNSAGGTLDINGNNVALANPIGNSGAGGLTLIDSGSAATLTLNGANAYSGGTTVSSGTLIANVNNALPTNAAVVNNSVLVVNGSNAVGAITGSGKLTVGAGANTLQIAANSAQSSQTSITVAAGSTLDITNNSIVLTPTAGTQATELAYYLGLVKQGYNSGSWTGTGITSSAVAAANAVTPLYGIAVAENDGSYGTVVGLGAGQIEIAEAVIGDATLSGTVNFADFVKVEGNYGLTGADWDEGDFFYTGTVNFADFVAVEANFGDTNAISAPEMAAMQSFAGKFGDTLVANSDRVGFQVVSVPEPASVSLLAIGALALLRRARKQK